MALWSYSGGEIPFRGKGQLSIQHQGVQRQSQGNDADYDRSWISKTIVTLDLFNINLYFQSRSNQRLLSLWEKCLATFCPIWGFSLHDQKIQKTKLNWNIFFTWHSLRGRKKTVSFSERKRNDSEISTSDTTTDNNGRSLDTEVSDSDINILWIQISEKVIYIKGRFSRSRTLSATTRRRRRGAVCRVRGGAGRLALARLAMGTVLLIIFFFWGQGRWW